MKLWQRVALVVGVVSVSSLLFTGVVAIVVAGNSATATADLAQERDVLAVASTVDRWLQEQAAFLTGWALVFDLPSLDDSRRNGLSRAILTAMPSTRVVLLIDGDGVPIGEPATLESVDPGELKTLVDALPVTEALASVEGVAFGGPTARRTLPVVVVASRDPAILVAAELSLQIARDLEARTTPDHAVVLVDPLGQAIIGGDSDLLDLTLLRGVLGNVARSLSYRVGERRVRGAIAPVSVTGWSVIMLESEDIALDGANRIRRLLPLVVGAAMVLAVVMGLVLAQSVTEPIARLRDSALSLAEGRFGTTTEIDRADEVGDLARAFDHLSRNLAENQVELQRQRNEIEAFNRDLQQRVAAATAELRAAQAQLVRAGQLAAVAQLGAGLAHELNNPLTAVLGLTQMLRAQSHTQTEDQDLALLEREALRCRGVVDAMVRMTDADEESGAPLLAVLADVRGAVGSSARERGIKLEWGSAPDVMLDAGPGATLRALSQLIHAIITGLPSGALLRIDAERVDAWVMIALRSDHPVGVERDDWMVSGLDLWVARQSLDQLGAQLIEPLDSEAPWQVRWELRGGSTC